MFSNAENSIAYREDKLEQYVQTGQNQVYMGELNSKISALGQIYEEQERLAIAKRNQMEKVVSEYEKGKKTLEGLNKDIFAKEM